MGPKGKGRGDGASRAAEGGGRRQERLERAARSSCFRLRRSVGPSTSRRKRKYYERREGGRARQRQGRGNMGALNGVLCCDMRGVGAGVEGWVGRVDARSTRGL